MEGDSSVYTVISIGYNSPFTRQETSTQKTFAIPAGIFANAAAVRVALFQYRGSLNFFFTEQFSCIRSSGRHVNWAENRMTELHNVQLGLGLGLGSVLDLETAMSSLS